MTKFSELLSPLKRISGSRGWKRSPLSSGAKFLHFHAVFPNIQWIGWCLLGIGSPLWEILDPPLKRVVVVVLSRLLYLFSSVLNLRSHFSRKLMMPTRIPKKFAFCFRLLKPTKCVNDWPNWFLLLLYFPQKIYQ